MDVVVCGRNAVPLIVRKTNFRALTEEYSLEFQVPIFVEDSTFDFHLCHFSKKFPTDEISINIGSWTDIVEPVQSFLKEVLTIEGVDVLIINENVAYINNSETLSKQTQTDICDLILNTWKPLVVHSVDSDGEIMITTAD